MRQVDPSLLEAMALVERKFTRLTLVAAMGFMVAWLPFCLLCMWELATPPDEIPTSKTHFYTEQYSFVSVRSGQVRSDQVWSNSDSNSNSNLKVGPELYTKIGFHHHHHRHSPPPSLNECLKRRVLSKSCLYYHDDLRMTFRMT